MVILVLKMMIFCMRKRGINEIKLPLVIIIKVKSPILVGNNHNDYDSAGKGDDLYI